MFLNFPYFKFFQSLHNLYFQREQIPYQIKDHGFSTSLASSSSSFSSSSSSSSFFGSISFAVFHEATRKASHLRSLSTRPDGAERPVVHVDPATGKADDPHRNKLRTYFGIVAHDKVDMTYKNWKEFKSDLTKKWALEADQDGVDDTVCEKYDISKEKWAQFCQTRRDPSWEKLLAEKTKKKLEKAGQSGSIDGIIDPPSPVKRHVKWKMVRVKTIGEMTTEAAKEIAEKIDSFEERATQGSFIPHGHQDVLTAAIRRPEHPGHVRAAGFGVTIKQYFGSAPWTSRSSSSLPLEELQQLT
ncbi:hypothetical protein GmHk_14G041762 [Glycine max]|nr:hypothetical protein GmHk_14G041762 [Glycine max]KAH1213902.1 hypothetical protein GmHk_14G041762 [Glycine max]